MLVLSVALAGVICDGGRYFGGNSSSCVTIEECKNQTMHPYALAKACIRDFPDTSTGLYENEEGAYECPSNMVTVFSNSVVECVFSLDECTGLFRSPNKSACVDLAGRCDSYLRLDVYDENGEKLCLTGEECKAKGATFWYSFYYCKSAAQCAAEGLHAYVIGNQQRCREEPPATGGGFDLTLAESGILKCADAQMLLDFSGDEVRCIHAEDCKHLYSNDPMCQTEQQCYSQSKYLYVNGSRR